MLEQAVEWLPLGQCTCNLQLDCRYDIMTLIYYNASCVMHLTCTCVRPQSMCTWLSIHIHVHVYMCVSVFLSSECEYVEEMQPYSEEDLSIFYPNPQLDTQSVLVDTFIRVSWMKGCGLGGVCDCTSVVILKLLVCVCVERAGC